MKPTKKLPAWTPEELDLLSEITPDDIAEAQADTERVAPLMAKLLEAQPEEQGEAA